MMQEHKILFSLPDWKQPELAHFKTGDKCARITTQLKARCINAMRQESADAFLQDLPKANEQFHILSNGKFDYWQLVATGLKLCDCTIDHLFLSTWTINLPISREIISLLESKKNKGLHNLAKRLFEKPRPPRLELFNRAFARTKTKDFFNKKSCKNRRLEMFRRPMFCFIRQRQFDSQPENRTKLHCSILRALQFLRVGI